MRLTSKYLDEVLYDLPDRKDYEDDNKIMLDEWFNAIDRQNILSNECSQVRNTYKSCVAMRMLNTILKYRDRFEQ